MRHSSQPDEAAAGAAREATGRWTEEEHEAFLRGIDLYGKDWKRVSKLIKTRTIVQIRTHAQKFFLKEARSSPAEASGPQPLRLLDRRLRDTPLLQPFLKQFRQENPESLPRLRDFLSPTLFSSNGEEVATDIQSLSGDSDESTEARRRLLRSVQPPDWYRYGWSLQSLLANAEALDWAQSSISQLRTPSFSCSPSPLPDVSASGPVDRSDREFYLGASPRLVDLVGVIDDSLLDYAVLSDIVDRVPDAQGFRRQD